MTPKQEAAIRAHGERLLAIFPDAKERDPVTLCKKLRRIENAAHRYAERVCSEHYYNRWTDENGDDIGDRKLEQRVHKLLGSDRPFLNMDPRGYALKVKLQDGETLTRDWGSYGILAPEFDSEGN